jgi:DNA excision repair protein ERCC-3
MDHDMPSMNASQATTKPLLVQGDFTLLLEVDNPLYHAARDLVSRFAELVKSPEYLHTYRITPLSVWNAAAAGMASEEMIDVLQQFSRYEVPEHVRVELREMATRFGRLELHKQPDGTLTLEADEPLLAEEAWGREDVRRYLDKRRSPTSFAVRPLHRGRLKQALIKAGYPALDLAGYTDGEPLRVELRDVSQHEQPCALRPYQREAVDIFFADGANHGGAGVIALPCGAGKTLVGLGVMEVVQTSTLIVTTGVASTRQWLAEILDKSHLLPEQIGEYTGELKQIRPVTVTTYQTLTYRPRKEDSFPHFALFDERNWGLIIYDEVHLLPAPVFQVTAELQARRRLGLTATLVREDGKQDDVFALIGPKKYDVPWKDMERQGWIAKAVCTEVRIAMSADLRMQVAVAPRQRKFRLASENPDKNAVVEQLIARHNGEPTLVIGMYLEQLKVIAKRLGAPLLTGSTSHKRRDELYAAFRAGEIRVLVVSKVANFAVDLPDASVAIQVSGTFGSRQEEAQRLGRLLRPKAGERQAHFYSLTSRDSVEQEYAMRRQLFLTEQGYAYRIIDREALEQ